MNVESPHGKLHGADEWTFLNLFIAAVQLCRGCCYRNADIRNGNIKKTKTTYVLDEEIFRGGFAKRRPTVNFVVDLMWSRVFKAQWPVCKQKQPIELWERVNWRLRGITRGDR